MTSLRSDLRIAYGIEGVIEPVVDVGQQVLVDLPEEAGGGFGLYVVARCEPMPRSFPLVMDFGALTAGQTLANVDPEAWLDCPDGKFAQYRARVIDDVNISFMPMGVTTAYTNRYQTTYLSVTGAIEDRCDHLSEFYVIGNSRPTLSVTNRQAVNIDQSRVMFYGFIFNIEGSDGISAGSELPTPYARYETIDEALASGEEFTFIPTGGLPL